METETYYSDICDFGYDSKHTVRAWPTDMLLTPQLKHKMHLTFKCKVAVIAKYDQDGNEVSGAAQQPEDEGAEYEQLPLSAMYESKSQSKSKAKVKHIEAVLENANLMAMHAMPSSPAATAYADVDADVGGDDDADEETQDKRAQVRYWLERVVGCGEYYDMFMEHGLDDIDLVRTLSMEELDALGFVSKLGHRKKILRAIDQLNNIKLTSIFWKLFDPERID